MMDNPIVTIKQGSLRGAQDTSVEGVKYLNFLGIPYAEPPINDLRFKDPVPIKSWDGVRDALKEGEISLHHDVVGQKLIGSEDCLYLNVYTTSLTEKNPVMLWIHGGGFNLGCSSKLYYRPDYFMPHKIVFVSVTYRLGVFGFLNMELEDCAGNQGIKDQILALHWVQENISAFGGDPNNVTIFGESAGAISVHALCLSPLANGLFHKAILQSGALYIYWAYKHSHKKCGLRLAKHVQSNVKNDRQAVDCLRKISADDLALLRQKLFPLKDFDLHFLFVLSHDKASLSPVFPKPLDEMETSIDVPIIMGYNSHEGLPFIDSRQPAIDMYHYYFDQVLRRNLNTEKNVSLIARKIREYYFGERPITEKEISGISQFKSDTFVVNGVQHLIDLQTRGKKPTYLYRLSFIPEITYTKLVRDLPIPGCCHYDDVALMFYSEKIGYIGILKKNSKDYITMERITRMWTDFARYGNPTPRIDKIIPIKWEPISEENKYFLEINEELALGKNPGTSAWNFWKDLDTIGINF